jgi:hypothetical protein
MICSRCKKQFNSQQYKTCDLCRSYNKNLRDKIERQYKQGQYSSTDNINKQCSDCLEIKLLENFYKNKRYKDGYRNHCKDCHSIRWKTYYDNGYNKILKDKAINDMIYKLKQNQKSYIHQQLKNNNLTKNNNTDKYLGCSIEQLKKWLEFQFNGDMNWINKSWQIDHIIPVSLFNLKNEDEIKIAFNWTNMQPLLKKDNLEKYNNLRPYEYFNSIINISRFIKKENLKQEEYKNVNNSLQWIQNYLRHFQTAGNSLELKLPLLLGNF